MCNNALDLNKTQLYINNKNWPNVNCKWVISSEGNNSYLSLEIEEINVSTRVVNFFLKVTQKVSLSVQSVNFETFLIF